MPESTSSPAEVQGNQPALFSLLAKQPEPVLVADQDGRVIFANRAVEELLDTCETGQPVIPLMPQENVGEMIALAAATDQTQQMEIVWENTRVFNTLFLPLAGIGVVICMHDISHLKQLNEVNSPVAGAPELRPGALSAELGSEDGAFTPPSGGGAPAPLHPQGGLLLVKGV